MKKIAIILLAISLILTASACNGKNTDPDGTAKIECTASVPSAATVSSEPAVPSSQSEATDSSAQSTEQTASVSSAVTSSKYQLKEYDVEVGEYTVTDAENARGLSTKKYGFGFGVAKNGKAHEISFDNQKRFDSLNGVKALALDTVSTDKRMYLTFDCGYEYKNLSADILDTLKEKNVKAAFFVTLSYLKSNPEYVERMINEGHIVGNHSATHPVFPDISRTKMAEELFRVDEYLMKHFNYKNEYFRFPTGAYSENSLELVTSVGYKSVFWSLAYGDYDTDKQMGSEKAFKTVTSRFHPGAVILLHAISEDNAAILGRLIDEATAQGYTFKTLDEYGGF